MIYSSKYKPGQGSNLNEMLSPTPLDRWRQSVLEEPFGRAVEVLYDLTRPTNDRVLSIDFGPAG